MADLPNSQPPESADPKDQMKQGLGSFWSGVRQFFTTLIDLKDGLDREGTIINIKSNKRMRGANAWMLMCSIVIASLGLDLNSPAVIIGAMLISPLMSPILGVGLGVGINDKNTLIISLQHFGMAIAIALVTSTIYFLLTPFGDITQEISNRTAPTLLDAFVAFFGGIAGIISGSRKDKSNAIPGVAIATALMPPLCVTGFGLANWMQYGRVKPSFTSLTNLNNLEIIANSFYLFFLNAVLVALATFLIVRFLRFPVKQYVDATEGRRTNMMVFAVATLLLIPSVILMRSVLKDARQDHDIRMALQECFGKEMKYVDGWRKIKTDSTTNLLVKVYGTSIRNAKQKEIYESLLEEKLPNIQSELILTSEIDLSKIKTLETRIDSIGNQRFLQPLSQKDLQIQQLQDNLQLLQSDSVLELAIKAEVLSMYPEYIEQVAFSIPKRKDNPAMLSLSWRKRRSIPKQLIEQSLTGYLQKRSGRDSVLIGYLGSR